VKCKSQGMWEGIGLFLGDEGDGGCRVMRQQNNMMEQSGIKVTDHL